MTHSFRLSVKIFVVLFTINAFIWPYADADLWGHLTFGEQIWTTQAIPATDTYSYTANGERWINHAWLTEILFYLIFSVAGIALFGMVTAIELIEDS